MSENLTDYILKLLFHCMLHFLTIVIVDAFESFKTINMYIYIYIYIYI